MELGETWTLRQGRTTLGRIEITEIDFPWLRGRWQPAEAFESVRPLFDRELELLEGPDEEWDDAYTMIWRAGVRLYYPNGAMVPEFLLHVDGDAAWFRWSDEPFENEGDLIV